MDVQRRLYTCDLLFSVNSLYLFNNLYTFNKIDYVVSDRLFRMLYGMLSGPTVVLPAMFIDEFKSLIVNR